MSDVPSGAEPVPAPAHSVADPGPLGLAAFAMTTFALSVANTNVWIAALPPRSGSRSSTADCAAARGHVGVRPQEHLRGACLHLIRGLLDHVLRACQVRRRRDPALSIPDTVGVFLLGWTIFTFYMLIASLRTNAVLAIVFLLLTIAFVCLTIGAFNTSTHMNEAGGWFGLATAIVAWYASFAGVVNETWKKPVIPLFPIS